MDTEQSQAYKEAINEYRAVSQARMTQNFQSTCTNITRILPKRQLSNYFVQLRKIANHPPFLGRIDSDEDVILFAKWLHPKGAFGFECTLDSVMKEIKTYSDFMLHRVNVAHFGLAHSLRSGSNNFEPVNTDIQGTPSQL